jgi:hypothetical protein
VIDLEVLISKGSLDIVFIDLYSFTEEMKVSIENLVTGINACTLQIKRDRNMSCSEEFLLKSAWLKICVLYRSPEEK